MLGSSEASTATLAFSSVAPALMRVRLGCLNALLPSISPSRSSRSLPHTLTPLQTPFDAFVLTNTGEIASHQQSMQRERVRSVGISILGGNSGVEGPYELGVDEIRAVNEEDVTVAPREPRSVFSKLVQWTDNYVLNLGQENSDSPV